MLASQPPEYTLRSDIRQRHQPRRRASVARDDDFFSGLYLVKQTGQMILQVTDIDDSHEVTVDA